MSVERRQVDAPHDANETTGYYGPTSARTHLSTADISETGSGSEPNRVVRGSHPGLLALARVSDGTPRAPT